MTELIQFNQYKIDSGRINCQLVCTRAADEAYDCVAKADELLSKPDLSGKFATLHFKKSDFLTDGRTVTFTQVPMFRLVPSGSNEERAFWHLYQSLTEEQAA